MLEIRTSVWTAKTLSELDTGIQLDDTNLSNVRLTVRSVKVGIHCLARLAALAAVFSNAFKRWEAKSDQPPAERWSPEDLQRNAATNEALIDLFEELFP